MQTRSQRHPWFSWSRKPVTSVGMLLAIVLPALALAAPKEDPVQVVNQKVAEIDQAIQDEALPSIAIQEEVESEGVPPSYKLYTRGAGGKLVAAIVTVGHETWGNTFAYYFDDQQRIMKYSKSCQGRPDCEAKTAIVYGPAGKVLWKNTNAPHAPPARIVALFELITGLREQLGRY